MTDRTPAEFAHDAIQAAHSTDTRETLLARIRLLEQALDRFEERERRYAYILRAFYFSTFNETLQPLIGLALELNPEIMEQRR